MDKTRKNSLRLQGYDYANNGSYFVTICSFNRLNIFSTIRKSEVVLSPIGIMINEALKQTSSLRNYVTIGEFVIMPNHIHVVIHIHKDSDGPEWLPTSNIYSRLIIDEHYKNRFGSQSNNLASIIRGIKSSVTTNARKAGMTEKIWQRNYHDRVIRNHEELVKIENYIHENPSKWFYDEYFS